MYVITFLLDTEVLEKFLVYSSVYKLEIWHRWYSEQAIF